MKTKLCVFAVVALVIWGMKRHYADARPDDLWWILAPTARLVGVMTDTAFAVVPGEGYVSHARLFVIEKSCAGINFMIAAFGMLVFALLHRVTTAGSGVRVLAAAMLASYAAAVLVNAMRITIAMWLADHPMAPAAITAADVHRYEGVAVYFIGLVLLHELVRRVECVVRTFRHAALPLGWYYLVTLGLPLANGAAQSGAAFARHALVVLIVPPILIGCACALHKMAHVFADRRVADS